MLRVEALLWLVVIFLAFVPGVALLWYIRRLDKYEPEPWSMIWRAFFAGCLSVLPALIIEPLLGFNVSGFVGTVFSAFVVAGLTEEVCKGGLAYIFMWRRPEFNEVMDGVVYFGVAHMGFAITENLMYVILKPAGNIVQALMTGFARTTTAVPLHVINGMIMGYHMGQARYATTPAERRKNFFQAFAIPILLHGIYDVAAFNSEGKVKTISDLISVGFGTALMYAAVAALWMVLLPRVKKAQEASPFRPQDWPTMPVAPTGCPNCGSAYPMGANYCHICAAPVGQVQQQYYSQAPGSQQQPM
jgi:RsiW-degrading membrane proteinase PrsW (M82 family)